MHRLLRDLQELLGQEVKVRIRLKVVDETVKAAVDEMKDGEVVSS